MEASHSIGLRRIDIDFLLKKRPDSFAIGLHDRIRQTRIAAGGSGRIQSAHEQTCC
jgi:hypothetical protein